MIMKSNGAMIPAGVAPHIVGTPAFIAPECLKHAALDGQTDLFSLGAALYFVLTGDHAYRAHSIASLQERWLEPVPAPLGWLKFRADGNVNWQRGRPG